MWNCNRWAWNLHLFLSNVNQGNFSVFSFSPLKETHSNSGCRADHNLLAVCIFLSRRIVYRSHECVRARVNNWIHYHSRAVFLFWLVGRMKETVVCGNKRKEDRGAKWIPDMCPKLTWMAELKVITWKCVWCVSIMWRSKRHDVKRLLIYWTIIRLSFWLLLQLTPKTYPRMAFLASNVASGNFRFSRPNSLP